MRLILISILAVVLIGAAGQSRADERAVSIQSVIERQIAAFRADDLEEAFSFAAPGIQRMFGDPQSFGRMVQKGYPMVWRPASYEMLQLIETDSGLVQVVAFLDAAGVEHEAAYLMKQVDGAWRIAGVQLRRRPGVGT